MELLKQYGCFIMNGVGVLIGVGFMSESLFALLLLLLGGYNIACRLMCKGSCPLTGVAKTPDADGAEQADG